MKLDGRPETAEEYVYLVDQLLFELEELRVAAEYDMDSLGAANEFLDDLEGQVRELRAAMADGSYRFGKDDLPFMKMVEAQNDLILPFKQIFRVVNKTHREGLAVDED
jgi:hypothetical protein